MLNVLFTSAGRRVELLCLFRSAYEERRFNQAGRDLWGTRSKRSLLGLPQVRIP